MPSLIAQIAAARVQQAQQQGGGFIRRGPVTVYQPGGFTKRQPVPTGPPPRQISRAEERQQGAPNWDAVVKAYSSTPEAKKQAEEQAKKQYEAAHPATGWDQLGKGLGILVNNPITQAVSIPLGMLGTGRRAIEYGIEQFAEHVPQAAQEVINAVARQGAPQGAPTIRPEAAVARAVTSKPSGGIIDIQRTQADPRNFVSKVLDPRSDFGYGQFLDPKNGEWVNRFVGLGGDVAVDPLTYVGAGATKLIGGGAREAEAMSRAYEVAQGSRQIATEARTLNRAPELIAQADQHAVEAASRYQKAVEAFRASQSVAPIHGGAASRAQIIADFVAKDPELGAQFQAELQKVGQRGFSAASPELRQAMSLGEPGLRLRGFGTRVPFTGLAGRATGLVGQAGRVAMTEAPGLRNLEGRAPEGLERARGVLVRGQPATPKEFQEAALMQTMADAARQGTGAVTSRGNRALSRLVRGKFKGLSADAIRTMTHEAEVNPEPNAVNDLMQKFRGLYKQVTGQDIGAELDPKTYLTHVHTPEAKRFLARLMKNGDVRAADYMNTAGFLKDDLLEGSGFLEHARVLKPSAPGVPTDIPIGQSGTITLTNGSIDELNTQLKKLFPEFKGKFYQDDPVKIGEAYLTSIARDAGRTKALNEAAAGKSPLVQRIEGPLAEELKARNEAFRQQNPVASYIEQAGAPPTTPTTPEEAAAAQQLTGTGVTPAPGAITPGAPLAPLPERPPEPADTGVFGKQIAREATKERARMVQTQGPAVKQTLVGDVNSVRQDVREALSELRKDMRKSATKEVGVQNKALRVLDRQLAANQTLFNQLSKARDVTADDLTKFLVGIRSDITDLETELAGHEATYKGRMDRARRIVVKKLKANITALRELETKARTAIAGAPMAAREEAAQRAAKLNAPIVAAQRALENARTEALAKAGAPSPERIKWAEGVLAEAEPGRNHADALREEYRQALSGEGAGNLDLKRTKTGRLTAESQRRLDARVVEMRQQFQERTAAQPPPSMGEPAVNPAAVPVGGRTARLYDEVQAQIKGYDQQIEAATNPKVATALTRKRDALAAQFEQPGARFYSERHARAVLQEQAQAETEIAASLAPYERELRKQQILADNRAAYPPLTRTEQRIQTTPFGAARPSTGPPVRRLDLGATEREAIAQQANWARQQILNQQQNIAYAQQRIPEMYERLGNVGAEPQLQQIAQERAGVVEPLQQRLGVAQDLKSETLKIQGDRLRALDEERVGVQHELHDQLSDRRVMVQKRRALERTGRALYRAGEPMKAKAGQLEGVVSDLRAVAQANPLLDDNALNTTEALLNIQNEHLDDASSKALRAKQVEQMMVDAKNGKLAKIFTTALNDNWRMIHEGMLAEGDIIVDRGLYDQFQRLFELNKQPSLLGRTFNAYTNLFKTYATLSPGFHVRNALSAIFMNTSDGVGLGDQLLGAKLWRQYEKQGDEWLLKQPQHIQDAFMAVEGSGAGGRFSEAGFAGRQGERRWYDRFASNRLTRLSQRAGQRVEGSVRLGMALNSIGNGETINEAMSRISRVHFDYGQISSFDRTMKQFIPFWTFMSRNLPLQIAQMYTKPGLYAAYDSYVRNFSATPEPFTPEYWTRGGAFNTGVKVPDLPLGGAQGLPIYFNPDFGLQRAQAQIQEIGQALGGDVGPLASEFNPGVTAPIEYATKQDFFTGRQYKPTDYSKVGGIGGIPVNVLARVFGQTNKAGEVSENFQNLLRSVNPISERTARLTPQLSGGNAEDRARQLESWLRFGGAPIRFLTPKQQESEAYRRYHALLDAQAEIDAINRRALQAAQAS